MVFLDDAEWSARVRFDKNHQNSANIVYHKICVELVDILLLGCVIGRIMLFCFYMQMQYFTVSTHKTQLL